MRSEGLRCGFDKRSVPIGYTGRIKTPFAGKFAGKMLANLLKASFHFERRGESNSPECAEKLFGKAVGVGL